MAKRRKRENMVDAKKGPKKSRTQAELQEYFKTAYQGNPLDANPVFQKCLGYLRARPKGRLLDVGCSDGAFCGPLVREGWECHGIELDEKYAAMARRKGVKAKAQDITKGFGYPAGYFDYVFAGEIIEHLMDTDFFLRECNRVLKKGGLLIITTPNFVYLRHRIELLFGTYPVCMWPRFEQHIRMFTHKKMKEALEASGFEVERWLTSYFLFSRARMKTLGRIFENISDVHPPLLSSQIIAMAKKK